MIERDRFAKQLPCTPPLPRAFSAAQTLAGHQAIAACSHVLPSILALRQSVLCCGDLRHSRRHSVEPCTALSVMRTKANAFQEMQFVTIPIRINLMVPILDRLQGAYVY